MNNSLKIVAIATLLTTSISASSFKTLKNVGDSVTMEGKTFDLTLWAQQSGVVTKPGFYITYEVLCDNCVTSGKTKVYVTFGTKTLTIKYQKTQTVLFMIPHQERQNGRIGREFYTLKIKCTKK